jgi:hypothetical protein
VPQTNDNTPSDLETNIEEAELATLSTSKPTSDEEDEKDFADIVKAVAEGEISPDELQDELVEWANRRLDMPFVPEALEAQLLGLTMDLLVTAVTELATSLA